MSKARTRIFVCLVALLLPLSAAAQNAPGTLAEMWTVIPKAGHSKDFFDGLKEHVALRTEHGDPRTWKVYTPLLGDQLDLVGIRTCCVEWADMDAYREWSADNPAVSKHWQEKVHPYVEHYGHYIDQVSWANSNIKADWGPYRLFLVKQFTLHPGKAGEFDAARDEVSQIALNQGWANEDRPWMWATAVGGEPSEMIVTFHENFADIADEKEDFFQFLSKVLGSEEAAEKRFSQMAAAVARQETQIWELQEEYSMSSGD